MSSDNIQKAIDLRKKGYSVSDISTNLHVSKGSVSTWVRSVALTNKQRSILKYRSYTPEIIEKRRQTRIKNEMEKRESIILNHSIEISKIDKNMLKMIGIALYWGEGAKTMKGMARISNSDPSIIKIGMRFFREICGVDNLRFRAHIHIHSKEAVASAEKYWSDITGIPIAQFYKTYHIKSKSSKNTKNNLKYGTIDIGVCDTSLLLKILGWIEGLKKQLII